LGHTCGDELFLLAQPLLLDVRDDVFRGPRVCS
jgi:hypothetical protein